MSEPTCRACYAQTLSDDEGQRFLTEPVTGCIHYCERHQAAVDLLHSIDVPFIKAPPLPEGLRFRRVEDDEST